MPANWRPAAIPLTGGLVTGSPPQSLEPGQFAQLDNATFDDDGAPQKRHGSSREQVTWGPVAGLPLDPEWVMGYGWAPSDYNLGNDPSNRTPAVRGLLTRNTDLAAYDGTRLLVRTPSLPQTWSSVKAPIFQNSTSGIPSTPDSHAACNVHIPHISTTHIYSSDDPDADTGFVACKGGIVGNKVELYARAVNADASVYLYANDLATGSSVLDRYEQTLTTPGTSDIDVLLGYIPPAAGAEYGVFVMAQGNRTGTDMVVAWAHEHDPGTWTSTVVSADYAHMAIRSDDNYVYVGHSLGSDEVYIERVDRFGTKVTFYLGTYTDCAAFDISVHPDGRLALAYVEDDGSTSIEVKYRFFDSDGVPTTGILLTDTTGEADIYRVTCEWNLLSARDLSGETPILIVHDCLAGNPTDRRVLAWQEVTEVGASFRQGEVVAPLDASPYLEIAAAAFRVGDTVFLPCRYKSEAGQDQNVLFYYDPNLRVESAGITADNCLRPCASWSRGAVEFTTMASTGHEVLQAPRVVGSVATWPSLSRRPLGSTRSVQRISVDMDAPLRSVQAGASTYVAGGIVREFDGRTLHEAGFLDVPKPTLTWNTGGSLVNGATYTYRIYLVHRNAAGEETRSAAITQTITLSDPSADGVSFSLPPIPLCTRPDARWEVYRSQANGTVLTRTRLLANGTVVDSVPASRNVSVGYLNSTFPAGISDNDSDADIAENPIDPVPFGVLDNVSPPACSVIAQGKDRVWYAGGDLLPGQVAYSKFWDPGETPGWNEALVVETDRVSPVNGIGFLGDWFVAMSSTSLYQFAGDGPSNLGLGDFTPGRLISTDTGCVSPDSLLLTPLGIAFQSQKGIRVLGHGGALLGGASGLLGSAVDGSFGQSVIGACVVPDQDHARWMLADGTMMVWDYSANAWARWTGYTVSAYGTPNVLRTWSGRMVVATGEDILIEDTEAALDGATPYRFIASTGWMQPHGALAWGRLRRWSLEGSALGPFTAQVYIDYDFKDGTRRQSYTWAASTLHVGQDGSTYDHDPGSWGSDASWGSGTWGGDTADGGAFPVNVRFNRQKATAFRFTVTDSTEPNLTLALRALGIEFAPMTGLVRIGGRNL